MSARRTVRGTAVAGLFYWFVLVCGLALLSARRIDEIDRLVPLWVAAAAGTGAGQLFGRLRLRLWLVGFAVVNLMWIVPLLWLPFLHEIPGQAMEIALMAFVPAALSGYLSLSERGGLVAFWFPAAVWMIPILDDARGGQDRWLLLGALAIAMVAFLLAREARRVALWQAHAPQRLAVARPAVVLREAPLRTAIRGGWTAALGAGTFVLTAWVAPHLWHEEKAPGPAAAHPTGPAGSAASSYEDAWRRAMPCCGDMPIEEEPRSRVSEYLPFVRPHGESVPLPPNGCVACSGGEPIVAEPAPVTGTGTGQASASMPAGAVLPTTVPPAVPAAPVAPPGPSLPAPAAAPAPAPVAAAPLVDPFPAPAGAPPRPPPPPHPAATVTAAAPAPLDFPIEGLLALSIAGLALHVATRPLRRLVMLRHLTRPLWPETVGQRISNLWQLVLIGLRDAGWVAAPGEQPGELARRVGLEGLETCAVVLERARHGVRVDAADLDAMERAAAEVYRAARLRIGWAARAASWLRWPLVDTSADSQQSLPMK